MHNAINNINNIILKAEKNPSPSISRIKEAILPMNNFRIAHNTFINSRISMCTNGGGLVVQRRDSHPRFPTPRAYNGREYLYL